jgi:hypothetical protein
MILQMFFMFPDTCGGLGGSSSHPWDVKKKIEFGSKALAMAKIYIAIATIL